VARLAGGGEAALTAALLGRMIVRAAMVERPDMA